MDRLGRLSLLEILVGTSRFNKPSTHRLEAGEFNGRLKARRPKGRDRERTLSCRNPGRLVDGSVGSPINVTRMAASTPIYWK